MLNKDISFCHFFILSFLFRTFAPAKRKRGVAQLVAFLVWDQAVAGSSPVTSTSSITPADFYESAVFLSLEMQKNLKLWMLLRYSTNTNL